MTGNSRLYEIANDVLISQLLKNSSLFTVFANFHGVNTHMAVLNYHAHKIPECVTISFHELLEGGSSIPLERAHSIVSLAPSTADEVIPSNGSDICSSVLGNFWEVSSLSYPLHRFRQYFYSLLHLFGEDHSFMLLSQGYLKKLTLNFCEATS